MSMRGSHGLSCVKSGPGCFITSAIVFLKVVFSNKPNVEKRVAPSAAWCSQPLAARPLIAQQPSKISFVLLTEPGIFFGAVCLLSVNKSESCTENCKYV